MMNARIALVTIGVLGLGGCADLMSVTTIENIKSSQFQFEATSSKSAIEVTNCMKESLLNYRSDSGKASFSRITFRDFEKLHEIMLRTGAPISVSIDEILFLIENTPEPSGGTRTHVWTHQYILNNGGAQGYLGMVTNTIRPCLGEPKPAPKSPNAAAERGGQEDPVKKLEQLKDMRDRGLITQEDYEKRKKDILDRM